MDITTTYKMDKKSFNKLTKRIELEVQQIVQTMVIQEAEAYLLDLENHMGKVSGSSPYADKAVKWSALDPESLDKEGTFWYESGGAKEALVINITKNNNKMNAFVGIQKGSEAYGHALWNELGFTPGNSDKLIRRPLFIPLSEIHVKALTKRLRENLQNKTIKIEVKV